MNEKAEWEIVDDTTQPKQPFEQGDVRRNFLYALLGKYPRLKLVGLAVIGSVIAALLVLFSLVALASAVVAGAIVLFAAWCKGKFFKNKKSFQVYVVRK
jgi:uncharacterized membrane protein YphA (DoxX/SURF4 family)